MCAECERLRREISAGFSRQRSECCVEQVWDLWLDSGVVCVINERGVQKRKEGGRKGSDSVSVRPRPPRARCAPQFFGYPSIHHAGKRRKAAVDFDDDFRTEMRIAESEPNYRRRMVCMKCKQEPKDPIENT